MGRSRPDEFAAFVEAFLSEHAPDEATIEAWEGEHGRNLGWLKEHGQLTDHPLHRAVTALRSKALAAFPDADLLALEHWLSRHRSPQYGRTARALEMWTLLFGADRAHAAFEILKRTSGYHSRWIPWLYDWILANADEATLRELLAAADRYLRHPEGASDKDHRRGVKAAYYLLAAGKMSHNEVFPYLRRACNILPQPPEPAPVVRATMGFLAGVLRERWDDPSLHDFMTSPFKGSDTLFPGKTIFLAASERLAALGGLSRKRLSGTPGSTLWSILRHSYPESREEVTEVEPALKSLPEDALLDALVVAIAWGDAIERALGWAGAAAAAAWAYAHTKTWTEEFGLEAEFDRLLQRKRSLIESISRCDLAETFEGIADRARLLELESQLGRERLLRLVERFALVSDSPQAVEATFYARAILGENRAEILKRLSRHAAHVVKAMGLLPGEDVAERYAMLRRVREESKRYGMARRATLRAAVEVGLENLARAAGFDDSLFLTLHVERAVPAQATANVGPRELCIRFDGGKVALECVKAGKPLRSVPPAVRKSPAYVEIKEWLDELRSQHRRLRAWLEEAMIAGRTFRGRDLAALWDHPLGGPLLHPLVLRVNGRDLLAEGGRPFGDGDDVSIPHALDLDEHGARGVLQRRLVLLEWAQPVQQLFREVYRVAAHEESAIESRRFAGGQVVPGRAFSLLSTRGWRLEPGYGATRDFRRERLRAWLLFAETPEYFPQFDKLTTETVRFTGEGKDLALGDVPPRVFSEAMRDVDLVVSVATTLAETPWSPESMAALAGLVAEFAEKAGLANVRLAEPWVEIHGERGRYRVHLGSAAVHRDPGRHVALTPPMWARATPARLPVYDPDLRTVELVSKVLLLARDGEIRDRATLEALEP